MTRWEELIFGLILSTFVPGIAVPLILPKFSGAIVQTNKKDKKRSVYMSSLASLAAKSAAKSQLMPTWPGNQTKKNKKNLFPILKSNLNTVLEVLLQ